MILVDTSAIVEYDRATGSPVDLRLGELVAGEVPAAVTEPVVMEVLAGARNDRRAAELRRFLDRFALVRVEPVADFEAAAWCYRRCRASGVTPRGLLDCLIAAVAWRTGATLLAGDRDLVRVGGVLGLDLDPATTSG